MLGQVNEAQLGAGRFGFGQQAAQRGLIDLAAGEARLDGRLRRNQPLTDGNRRLLHLVKERLDAPCLVFGQPDLVLELQQVGRAGHAIEFGRQGQTPTA
ncbi:hypothetical protein RZS08_51545, partial [Arthrospira platensis SPKY1]|nr:hypothetical protein [Arthrospira platensis SPKY1]